MLYWDPDGLDILPGGVHEDLELEIAEALRESGIGVLVGPVSDPFLEALGFSLLDVFSGKPGTDSYQHHFFKILFKGEVAYVVTPDKKGFGNLENFKSGLQNGHITFFGGLAPSEFNAFSAAALQSLLTQQPGQALKYFGKAWQSALSNPGYYLYAGTIIAGAGSFRGTSGGTSPKALGPRVNLNPSTNPRVLTPRGRIVPGGVGAKPLVNLGGTNRPSPNLRFPSNRHFLSKASIPKSSGNSMFTISREAVAADVSEINANLAARVGNRFTTTSERVYGFHDDILFPISGPGVTSINSQQLNVITLYNRNSVKGLKTMDILLKKGILSEAEINVIKTLLGI